MKQKNLARLRKTQESSCKVILLYLPRAQLNQIDIKSDPLYFGLMGATRAFIEIFLE